MVQQIVSQISDSEGEARTVSDNAVEYTNSGNKRGWYIELPDTGERTIARARFVPIITDDGEDGYMVFSSITPSENVCEIGGTSWIMVVNYLTGGHPALEPALDRDGDGGFSGTVDNVHGFKINTIALDFAIIASYNGPGKILYPKGDDVLPGQMSYNNGTIGGRRSAWVELYRE